MSDFTGDSLGKHEDAYALLTMRHADFSERELVEVLEGDRLAIAEGLELLIEGRRAYVLEGGRYFSDRSAQRLRDTAKRTLEKYHRKNPFRAGMPMQELAEPLSRAAQIADFRALLAWLAAEGTLVLESDRARRPEFSIKPPRDWQPTLDEIEGVYRAAGFESPTPKSFTFPKHLPTPALFLILAEQGKLVELTDKILIHRETWERAREIARTLTQTPEGITVSTLKDALGLTRKTVLPLLEKFDATGFTQRNEDDSREVVGVQ